MNLFSIHQKAFRKTLLVSGFVSSCFSGFLHAQEPAAATPTEAAAPTEATSEGDRKQAQEVVRRQEAVFRAQTAIEDGQKAEKTGDVALAQERYRFAFTTLSQSETTKSLLATAGLGLGRVNYVLAKEALRKQRFDEAQKLLEEAETASPTNRDVKVLLTKVRASSKNPEVAGDLSNPAVSPAFADQVKKVESLFVEAEQYRRTGQYDEATASLKKIISIDPYNETAQRELQKILKEKLDYYKTAQMQTREQRNLEGEQKWGNLPKRATVQEVAVGTPAPITRSKRFEIGEKLRSIIIPTLDFKGASIADAALFLSAKSREQDKADKRGVQIIVKEDAKKTAKEVNLSLRNVPLSEALRYVTRVADVKYKIEEFAIIIVPLSETTDVMVNRVFNVSPTFINSSTLAADPAATTGGGRTLAAAAKPQNSGDAEAINQLREKGVEFPPGSSAVYSSAQGSLTVVNTQDQIDLIEELVNAEGGQSLVVEVSVKLVEIGQEDLNELTSNVDFNMVNTAGNNLLGTIFNFGDGVGFDSTPQVSTALRGSQGFSVNGLDNAISATALPNPNAFKLGHTFDFARMHALLTALAQKKSTDLLASPSVRVKAGSKASMLASRKMLYATSFDKPAAITPPSNTGSGTTVVVVGPPIVIPAFPTAFDTKDVGVKLEVQPQVPSDRQTVELALAPEVTDFEGFINYGDPIRIQAAAGSTATLVLSENTINQPVFSTRKVTTKVFVKDKHTFVMGGLIREDLQKIEDKVPFFGDLPFIGRAFRSEATKSKKRNLLIFVTPKILLPDGTPLNGDAPVVANSTK